MLSSLEGSEWVPVGLHCQLGSNHDTCLLPQSSFMVPAFELWYRTCTQVSIPGLMFLKPSYTLFLQAPQAILLFLYERYFPLVFTVFWGESTGAFTKSSYHLPPCFLPLLLWNSERLPGFSAFQSWVGRLCSLPEAFLAQFRLPAGRCRTDSVQETPSPHLFSDVIFHLGTKHRSISG